MVNTRRRSPVRHLCLLLVAAATLTTTGCDAQRVQQILGVVQQVLPIFAGLSGQGGLTAPQMPSFTSLTNGAGLSPGPMPTSSISGVGSPNSSLTGGLPGFDSLGQGDPNQVTTTGSRAEIERLLRAAAQRHQIPADLLLAVAWQESRWDPNARSFDGGHGKGIMQIDDRFHDFAHTPQVFDAAANIEYGARFLREKYDQEGNWKDALERYNGGSDYPPIVLAHMQNRPWTQVA